jgi:Na+/serine symporter
MIEKEEVLVEDGSEKKLKRVVRVSTDEDLLTRLGSTMLLIMASVNPPVSWLPCRNNPFKFSLIHS